MFAALGRVQQCVKAIDIPRGWSNKWEGTGVCHLRIFTFSRVHWLQARLTWNWNTAPWCMPGKSQR